MTGVPASSRGISLSDVNVWTGNQTAPAWIASGLTGATAASRYVGATASGAPGSGTFSTGDYIIDQSGSIYVCTSGGSPGTWTQVGATFGATLFDSTLAGAAATIDTGASGIAAGHRMIMVLIYARTTQAVAISNILITLNNDSGGNYDQERRIDSNTATAVTGSVGSTSWNLDCPGNSAAANVFGSACIVIGNYTGTSGFKAGYVVAGSVDTSAANDVATNRALSYRSTSAISRLAVAAGSGNLAIGSRLTVIGL